MSTALRERWRVVTRTAHAARAEAIGDDLLRRWSEPHRHYHRTAHLEHCLREIDALADAIAVTDRAVLELAAWFHDAIYVARPDGESEEKSADLAERALSELEVDASVRARVRAIILATKRHQPTGDPTSDLFLDADLSVLGADPDVFDAYERGVRAEWSWVPDATFADGRATFVRAMLARPAIFLTERYRARLEARARKNLERSLVRLAAPGSTSG